MENGDVVWDDGMHRLTLPFDHQERRAEHKQQTTAIILSTVACSVVALVNLVQFLLGKWRNARTNNETENDAKSKTKDKVEGTNQCYSYIY